MSARTENQYFSATGQRVLICITKIKALYHS